MKLVFDLEANGLYQEATKIWCICAKNIDTGETYEWSRETENTETQSIVSFMETLETLEKSGELIGHNILNYDLPLLKKLTGWVPKKDVTITDTLVMSRLFNPDRRKPTGLTGKTGSHSLEAWGYRVGKSKPHHEEWSVFSTDMLRRCREDVGINVLTYFALQGEVSGYNWGYSQFLEHRIAKIITEQEHHGILFNDKKAVEYVSWLSDRIEQIDCEIVPRLPSSIEKIGQVPINNPFLKTGGYRKQTRDYLDEYFPGEETEGLVGGPFTRIKFLPFNLGSTEKVKCFLLESGWLPETWNFSKKTGERTSPKLEGEFRGIDGEIPKRIKERITWRHRRSQIEGWLERQRDDSRLSAGANPNGTPTGRMRHQGVVNLPKANIEKESGELIWDTDKQKVIFGTQMRSLFIAPEGFKIVGHDASGIQLRMLAHYMGDLEFINQILTGEIHEYNRRAAGLPNRDAAKTFIYAFIFGAGDEKLGSIIGGTAADGAMLRKKFLDSLPKLGKLIDSVKRAAGKGYLKGLDNRKLIMRRDDNGRIMRHKALNTLLQGAESVIMKTSCVILWSEVAKQNLEAYKILDMHDEGQAEVLIDHVEPYCPLAVNSIVKAGEVYNLNIPLAAEYKIGNNLAETH